MDTPQFVTRIRRLHVLQSATLRFAETGMTGLMRLNGLLKNDPLVRLADKDKVIMAVVLESRRWEGTLNRNYTVYGLSQADDGWLYEIGKDVESVELSDHGAKGIMSGRQKMRDEAVSAIINSVQTDAFVDELWGWKIDIAAYLEELEALPLIVFRLTYNGTTIASAAVDGWSGRIMINGQFGDELYVKPEQVQKVLRDRMESMLEKLTA